MRSMRPTRSSRLASSLASSFSRSCLRRFSSSLSAVPAPGSPGPASWRLRRACSARCLPARPSAAGRLLGRPAGPGPWAVAGRYSVDQLGWPLLGWPLLGLEGWRTAHRHARLAGHRLRVAALSGRSTASGRPCCRPRPSGRRSSASDRPPGPSACRSSASGSPAGMPPIGEGLSRGVHARIHRRRLGFAHAGHRAFRAVVGLSAALFSCVSGLASGEDSPGLASGLASDCRPWLLGARVRVPLLFLSSRLAMSWVSLAIFPCSLATLFGSLRVLVLGAVDFLLALDLLDRLDGLLSSLICFLMRSASSSVSRVARIS